MRRLTDLQERGEISERTIQMRDVSPQHGRDAGIRPDPVTGDWSGAQGKEFNVKFPRLADAIPDEAREKLGDAGVQNAIDDLVQQAHSEFENEVKEKFPWVGEVGLVGRSAGNLVIGDKTHGEESNEDDWNEIESLVQRHYDGVLHQIKNPQMWKDYLDIQGESRNIREAEPSPAEDDEPVVVLFRKWPDGDIDAVFPGLPGTDKPGSVAVYAHVGQHSSGDYQLIMRKTTAALPSEYEALQKELESAPYHYKLIPRSRAGRQDLWWTRRDESAPLGERERDDRVASGATHRHEIVDAMAKYAYASAWADAYAEKGGQFPPRTEIMDVAPPPTPEGKSVV